MFLGRLLQELEVTNTVSELGERLLKWKAIRPILNYLIHETSTRLHAGVPAVRLPLLSGSSTDASSHRCSPLWRIRGDDIHCYNDKRMLFEVVGETDMEHHLVGALIIQSNRILLGKRSSSRAFYPGVWDVFGGHIEQDEQPNQTLVRELQEELGITPIQWMDLETIVESIPGDDNHPPHDLIVYLYCVIAWEGTPTNRQPEEHSTIQWFSYAEAVQLDLADPIYPRLFAQCLQSTIDD